MVHVQSATKSDRNEHMDYWMLPQAGLWRLDAIIACLRRGGYKFSSSSKKAQLIPLFYRAQRGFYCYEKCHVNELRRFCVERYLIGASGNKNDLIVDERSAAIKEDHTIDHENAADREHLIVNEGSAANKEHLPVTATIAADRERLIAILTKADEERTFHGFASLPPELQTDILEYHFESFGTIKCPAQPPIAKVSHQLRKLALPLFYKTCTFDIEVKGVFETPDADPFIMPNVPIQSWINNTPNKHLQSIGKLHVRVNFLHREYSRQLGFDANGGCWDVNLGRADGDRRVEFLNWEGTSKFAFQQIDAGLRQIVGDVTARPGTQGLQREDFRTMSMIGIIERL